MGYLSALFLLGSAVTSLMAADDTQRGIGWWGDGNGYFADYSGPSEFDGATGKNIIWQQPALNWSNASPIVVGDLLVYINEPVDYRPLVVALDRHDGTQRWRLELDVVQALPAKQREHWSSLITQAWDWHYRHQTLLNRHRLAKTLATDLAVVEADMVAFGFQKHAKRKQWVIEQPEYVKEVSKAGFGWDAQWSHLGTWVGIAYGTPASDGKRVFVQTSNNLMSAMDLQGKILWQHHFPPTNTNQASRTVMQEHSDLLSGLKSWKGGVPGAGNFSTSPIVHGKLVISCGGRWIRAFDCATGQLRWQAPQRSEIGQGMGVPHVVELGDAAVLIPPGGSDKGVALRRVDDGTFLGWLPGQSAGKGGLFGALVQGDTVVVRGSKESLKILKLTMRADRAAVDVQQVASVPTGSRRSVLADGRIYFRDQIFDLSGKQLAEGLPALGGHAYWRSGMVLGKYFVSINHADGSFLFRDRMTGKQQGMGRVPRYVANGLPRALRLAQGCFAAQFGTPSYHNRKRTDTKTVLQRLEWMIAGAAFPYASGDRLYLRTYDHVWCVGRP